MLLDALETKAQKLSRPVKLGGFLGEPHGEAQSRSSHAVNHKLFRELAELEALSRYFFGVHLARSI